MARGWLVNLWVARGGGFYGLGFVVVFVILEIKTIFGDIDSSDNAVDFVMQEVMEIVLRLGYQSFINFVMALIWPAFLLERYEFWALGALVAGYFAFEKFLRPAIETRLPELRDARSLREDRKREKQERKRAKKAAKKRD